MRERHCELREASRQMMADCFVATGRLAMTLILCGILLSSRGQTKTFSSLSKYEKRWAFFHPFAALKIKKHRKEMYAVYEEVKKSNVLDQYTSGGKLDAFRHIFAMAWFSKFVSVRKLRKLGKAHEKGNYLDFKKGISEDGELADSISTVMDLANNEVGFILSKKLKQANIEVIKKEAVVYIIQGGAIIVKRNAEGRYVTCGGEVIAEEKKGIWNIPKCLVGSGS